MANEGGFSLGFGVHLSTPFALVVIVGSAIASACLIHHASRNKMPKQVPPITHSYFSSSHIDTTPSGMVPGNNSIEIGDMVLRNIHKRCKNPHQVSHNIERILDKIRGYEVYLRPLLQERLDGKISEHEYQHRLRSIVDHIAMEMQIPMHSGHHIIKPDLINHDGSTSDKDMGGEGWDTLSQRPHYHKWRFARHPSLTVDEAEPKIQDLAARMNFAALTTIGAGDSQHVPIARANNVELLDDYGFSHVPGLYLPVDQDIFTST